MVGSWVGDLKKFDNSLKKSHQNRFKSQRNRIKTLKKETEKRKMRKRQTTSFALLIYTEKLIFIYW